jgi:hypothetical protein
MQIPPLQKETDLDAIEAEKKAIDLVLGELGLQNGMWGQHNERSDISKGQLFAGGFAQLEATFDRRFEYEGAFKEIPDCYPQDWSGFRSYGGDIPNIVVGVAFFIQEIKRLLMKGEDPTRLARQPDQKYNPETGLPKTIEA